MLCLPPKIMKSKQRCLKVFPLRTCIQEWQDVENKKLWILRIRAYEVKFLLICFSLSNNSRAPRRVSECRLSTKLWPLTSCSPVYVFFISRNSTFIIWEIVRDCCIFFKFHEVILCVIAHGVGYPEDVWRSPVFLSNGIRWSNHTQHRELGGNIPTGRHSFLGFNIYSVSGLELVMIQSVCAWRTVIGYKFQGIKCWEYSPNWNG